MAFFPHVVISVCLLPPLAPSLLHYSTFLSYHHFLPFPFLRYSLFFPSHTNSLPFSDLLTFLSPSHPVPFFLSSQSLCLISLPIIPLHSLTSLLLTAPTFSPLLPLLTLSSFLLHYISLLQGAQNVLKTEIVCICYRLWSLWLWVIVGLKCWCSFLIGAVPPLPRSLLREGIWISTPPTWRMITVTFSRLGGLKLESRQVFIKLLEFYNTAISEADWICKLASQKVRVFSVIMSLYCFHIP